MPLEFALRPRFRLDERVATPRRRELPPLVLPVAAYWLGTAALTYRLVYAEPGEAAREPIAALATERAPRLHSPAPHVTAEPLTRPSQDWTSFASFDDEGRDSVPARPDPAQQEPASARAAKRSVSPRELFSARPNPAEPELPVVPQARTGEPPRIDSAPAPHRWLFEAQPTAPSREAATSSAPREPRNEVRDTGGALPTCEAVVAGDNQEIDLRSGRQAPDLSREALSGVLENGAYLTACGVPERTTLDICAAVQEGKVKGVTVVTRPADARLAACVRRAVARLRFPFGQRLDITRTRFDAAR